MHKIDRKWAARVGLLLSMVAVVASVPRLVPSSWLTVVIVSLHYAYLALCWNLVGGYAGQLCLGHSVFYGVGAYASTLLYVNLGLSPWVGMWIGGVVASIVALILSMIVFKNKVSGVYFALATMAAMEVVRGIANNLEFISGPVGILLPLKQDPHNMHFVARAPYYYIAVGFVVLAAVVTYLVERARIGHYLLAVREDETASASCGIDVEKAKTVITMGSAFLTALGGTFYAQFFLYVQPDIVFGFQPVLYMMLGTMVGGAATIAGPIVGSLVFGMTEEAVRWLPFATSYQASSISRMLYALVLMVVILYAPGGIVGTAMGRRLSLALRWLHWQESSETRVSK